MLKSATGRLKPSRPPHYRMLALLRHRALHTLRFQEDPILHKVCHKVKNIKSPIVQEINNSLDRIVKEEEGVGLAAPQIGEQLCIFTMMRFSDQENATYDTIINPKIISKSTSDIAFDFEGCLSIPGVVAVVPRHNVIKVEYQDYHTSLKKTETLSGVEARIFQHEFDHLNGILFLQHAIPNSFLNEHSYKNLTMEDYEAHVKKFSN